MAKRGKISELYSIAELEAQHEKVKGMVGDLVKIIGEVKPIAFKLEGAEKTKEIVDGMKQISAATEKITAATSEAVKQVDYLKKVEEETLKVQAKKVAASNDTAKALAQEKAALQQMNRELKLEAELNNAAVGTLQQMRAELAALNQYKNTKLVIGTEAYDDAVKKIAALNTAISVEEQKTGDFRRNVGNYTGSAKLIVEALDSVEKKMESLREKQQGLVNYSKANPIGFKLSGQAGELNQVNAQLEEAQREFLSLNKIASNPQFLNVSGSVGEATAEIKALSKAIDELNAKGLGNTDYAVAMKQRLSDLKTEAAGSKKSFDGLGFSVSQLAREVPAFANSVQTGFMAISNNLPILFDEISRTKKEIAAMRAEGKETKSLMGQLSSAFFSWGTVLTIGITLLTVYGKQIGEFVSSLFKGRDAMDAFVEKQKILNEALSDGSSEYKNAVSLVNELKINLQLAKDGLISKEGALKQYNETIGKTTGEVGSLDEAEKALAKNADAYVKMTLYKAAANLALGKAAEQAVKIQAELLKPKTTDDLVHGGDTEERNAQKLAENNEEVLALQKKFEEAFYQGNEKLAKEYAKKRDDLKKSLVENNRFKKEREELKSFEEIANEFQKKAAEISANGNWDFFGDDDKNGGKDSSSKALADARKAAFELAKLRQQVAIDNQKAVADNESLILKIRVDARMKQLEEEQKLAQIEKDYLLGEIDAQAAEEKKKKGITQAEIAAIDHKAALEREKVIEESGARIKELEVKSAVDIITIRKSIGDRIQKDAAAMNLLVQNENEKLLQKQIDAADKSYSNRVKGIEDAANAELSIELERYQKGEISKEQYEARKLAIENKARKAALLADIKHYEDLLKIAGLPADKEKEALEKLAALKKQLNAADVKDTEDVLAKKAELQQQYKDKVESLSKQAYDAFTQAIGYQYDEEKNRIQESIDNLEERSEKEIELVNKSSATEQEKADKIAIIEATTSAKKAKLEREQRNIEAEKARFEKLASLFNIGIQTTQDVFKIKAQASVLLSNPATAPLASMALAQIPVVISSGAIAAGLIAAKPIPKYFAGVDDHPGGLAIWGDGGVPEYAVTPDGNIYKSPATDTLVNLPEHTRVFPNEFAFMDALMAGQLNRSLNISEKKSEYEFERINKSIQQMEGSIVKAIKNKPEVHYHPGNGLGNWVRSNQSSSDFLKGL